MDDYYIVKRIAYDYDARSEYLTENGYDRDIRKVKIFNNVKDASDAKRSFKDHNCDYFIMRM